jgi:hypothetical protein
MTVEIVVDDKVEAILPSNTSWVIFNDVLRECVNGKQKQIVINYGVRKR